MRIVRELAHAECRITFFSWNNRYLIKLEQGLLEQTFKIDQFDVANESELEKIIDQEFIQKALLRFREMSESLAAAKQRAGI